VHRYAEYAEGSECAKYAEYAEYCKYCRTTSRVQSGAAGFRSRLHRVRSATGQVPLWTAKANPSRKESPALGRCTPVLDKATAIRSAIHSYRTESNLKAEAEPSDY
jgi:hypothetical protein